MGAPPTASSPLPGSLRPAALLLGLLLLLAPVGRAEDALPSAEQLLGDARYHQRALGLPEEALAKYEALLARADLKPEVRAAALWGAAECEAARGRWAEAEAYWDRVLADPRLPEDVRERAAQAKAKRAEEARAAAEAAAREARGAADHEDREARRRARLETLLGQARTALEQQHLEDARAAVMEALALDPESAEALRLQARIQQESPDRGLLLRALMEWFQTVRSESFQRLRTRLSDYEEKAARAQSKGDLAGADLAYREALALLDRSEFLPQLRAERHNLVFWLRQVIAAGSAQGQAFAPVPEAPLGSGVERSLKSRFFALVAEAIADREDRSDPLRFYEFLPALADEGSAQRSLGPTAFASRGIAVAQAPGDLSRARWAERWIRATLANDWPAARLTGARGGAPRRPAAAPAPRLLERQGDVLCVQHGEAVHREVEALRSAFAERPGPLQLDVALYAAGPGGTVRVARALNTPAPGVRDSGLDAVVQDRLIEECRKDLEVVENLTLLGTAQVRLQGEVAATLEVTERTETSPLYLNVGAPPLSLPGPEAARFGLFLSLYGEDLPGWRRGPRSGALSLSARVRMPLPSVVVRARGSEWLRLPKLASTEVEADRLVPHAGTLVLLGLPNPFLDTAAQFPDLVVLAALRPGSADGRPARTPDTPRYTPGQRDENSEHPLGALGVEVLDDVVLDGWPEDRSAAAPVAEAIARKARDEYLAGWLAARARLLTSSGTNPVAVHEGLASATLGDEEQVRLGRAAAELRAQETTLYEVDVIAAEVPAAAGEAWSQREGVTALPGGAAVVVPAALVRTLDAELARAEAGSGLFGLVLRQPVRATQQLVLRRLASHGLTRQMRVARSASSEALRFVPVPGTAEEGLVLQVRPGIEEAEGRVVAVRARAARLKGLDPVPLPDVNVPGLAVDVPRWFPVQDRSAGTLLKDGDALLLRLSLPDAPGNALLLRVLTRRLQ